MEKELNKKEKAHANYLRNKDYYRSYYKKKYATDEKYRNYILTRCKNTQAGWRIKIIALLGGVCTKCGFSDSRALQVDHINGGGNKERRLMDGNGSKYYRNIVGEIKKYQLLCANCNFIKRIEMGEHREGKYRK